MAIRAREFVGIAEGIKSHELSAKSKIESLKGTVSDLSSRRFGLNCEISSLEAELAAAYEDTDEDDEPNYALIDAIESQIASAENELSEVENELDDANSELSQSEIELAAVMEEKAQTLFEIQERTRKTSQNIATVGGMYGAYMDVGNTLQNSMQTSLASLSQAASILDDSVDGSSSGGAGGGQGRTASGGGASMPSDLSTSALSAFSGRSGDSSFSGGSSPSNFSTSHSGGATPASTHNFGSSQSVNPQKTINFNSGQSGSSFLSRAFSEEGSSDATEGSAKYSSSKTSQNMGNVINENEIYYFKNGMKVTKTSTIFRKYPKSVLFEGNMLFSYKRTKYNVALKRKIYQHSVDIDLNYIRYDGNTNLQAMLKGKPPIVTIDGSDTVLDLHHLSQEESISCSGAPFLQGTLAEVPAMTHKKYSKILHMRYPSLKGIRTSFRVVRMPNRKYIYSKDNKQFEAFKKQYWITRAEMLMNIK